MATIIDCRKHNYENFYTYTVSKDIDTDDEENSFQVDIDVRVNGWHESQTMWQPECGGIVIDYDSIEIQHQNHSDSEKKMIEYWVESNKYSFEDAFMKDGFQL